MPVGKVLLIVLERALGHAVPHCEFHDSPSLWIGGSLPATECWPVQWP
jgi:hypothetical protein